MAQQPLTVILRAPSPKSTLTAKWVAEVGSEADKVATLLRPVPTLVPAMVPAHHKATEAAARLLKATEVAARLLKATEVAAHLLKATEVAALSLK